MIKSGASDVPAACAMQGQAACEMSAPCLKVAQWELLGISGNNGRALKAEVKSGALC